GYARSRACPARHRSQVAAPGRRQHRRSLCRRAGRRTVSRQRQYPGIQIVGSFQSPAAAPAQTPAAQKADEPAHGRGEARGGHDRAARAVFQRARPRQSRARPRARQAQGRPAPGRARPRLAAQQGTPLALARSVIGFGSHTMRRAAAISLLLVSIPKTSFANAGIPLIVVFLPPLWIALPVVIIVEAIVVARFLDVPFWRAIAPVTAGNIASTIGGIPLLWIMIVLMQLLLPRLGIPFPAIGWLLPYEEDLWWMVPAALIVFAVPCFLISVAIEAPINRLGL